jgi:hypothetical protein
MREVSSRLVPLIYTQHLRLSDTKSPSVEAVHDSRTPQVALHLKPRPSLQRRRSAKSHLARG